MRLDALLMDEPAEHFRATISGIADQARRVEAEPVTAALDHVARGLVFGLADGCGCLHIHDDRVVQIDQIVGAVDEVGLAAISRRPTCGWVDRGNVPGLHRRRGTEGRVV